MMRREWEVITAAERDLDDRLAVGLIGGTGVGKSTLINALAGAEISRSGDRRPTTHRVIVYRHRSTKLPESIPRGDLSEPEVLHETRALERVILLDFPDFDSVEAAHHEILGRHFPHLDVLIVLVDDVKYADLRLYALLRKLPQAPENLHGVLNKIDRLEARYPARSKQVAGEILDDFAAKLEAHAGLKLARGELLALSARNALLHRSKGEACDSGDFDRLVAGLEEYRAEKRRRAAKELNLEVRKLALFSKLRTVGLERKKAERVDHAALEIDRRRTEFERLLSEISPAILSRRERNRLVSSKLGRTASKLGFPVDLLVTAAGHLPWRRAVGEESVELGALRVRQHYKPYLDSLKNLRRELSMDLAEVAPVAGLDSFEDSLPDVGMELERCVSDRLDRLPARSRLRNHSLAAGVTLFWIWTVVHPGVDATLRRLAGETGSTWGSVIRELFLAVLSSLSPLSMVSFIVSLGVAYAITTVLVWARRVQAIEAGVTEAEELVRDRVRSVGFRTLDVAFSVLSRWRGERAELASLVGEEKPVTP